VDYHLTTDGLIKFRERIYVLNNNELKNLTMRGFQDNPYLYHLGYQKTMTTMTNFYYWPNMKKGTTKFVARCFNYQEVKAECKHPGGLLQPITIPEWKWEVVSMDFITSFPRTSRQHDSIMVVVERLTKVAHFIPMKSTYSTSDVAQLFIKDVVRLHGVTKNIVSDRDAMFTSNFWKESFTFLGTKLAVSTTYNPQTDGQTERVNKTLEDIVTHSSHIYPSNRLVGLNM